MLEVTDSKEQILSWEANSCSVRIFPPFTETCSLQPAADRYSQPKESSPTQCYFCKIYFNIILSYTFMFSTLHFSFRGPERTWGPPNLLSRDYQGMLPLGQSSRGLKLTAYLYLVKSSWRSSTGVNSTWWKINWEEGVKKLWSIFEKLSRHFIEATEENYGFFRQGTLFPAAGPTSVAHSIA